MSCPKPANAASIGIKLDGDKLLQIARRTM